MSVRHLALAVVLWSACGHNDAPPPDASVDGSARPDAALDGSAPDAVAPDAGMDAGMDAGADHLIDDLVAALGNASTGEAGMESLLQPVAWQGGRPIHEDGRWLFVTRWTDAPGSVALVGDFNAWATTAHPAQVAPWGTHYWVVMTDAELGDPAGQKYKWWGAGDVWRAPPESTAYAYDAYGQVGYVRPPGDVSWLERFPDMTTPALPLPRTVRAYLPAGFVPGSAAAAAARILVLHDGQNVFSPDAPYGGWQVNDTLDAGYPGVVALAVDSVSDRMDAYSHVVDDPGLGSPVGGQADAYLDALLNVAIPFLVQRYGLSTDPTRRMVAGSSMGGLVTLYQALTRPDTLGCAAALSATLGWGAFASSADGSDALVRRWPSEAGHGAVALYLDSGGSVNGTCGDPDGDGVYEDSDDADNYCVVTQLRDTLLGLGYQSGVDLFHWWEPDALHNEASWAARFYRALDACTTAGW